MRFIWGHTILYLLSTVNAYSDGLNIYLALVSVALLGVGSRGGFSSHKFSPALWFGWHLPIGFFIFKWYIFQHLGYFLSLDSHPYPICKVS